VIRVFRCHDWYACVYIPSSWCRRALVKRCSGVWSGAVCLLRLGKASSYLAGELLKVQGIRKRVRKREGRQLSVAVVGVGRVCCGHRGEDATSEWSVHPSIHVTHKSRHMHSAISKKMKSCIRLRLSYVHFSDVPLRVQYLRAFLNQNINVKQKRGAYVQSCKKEGRTRNEV
jgi:hypothetical protein